VSFQNSLAYSWSRWFFKSSEKRDLLLSLSLLRIGSLWLFPQILVLLLQMSEGSVLRLKEFRPRSKRNLREFQNLKTTFQKRCKQIFAKTNCQNKFCNWVVKNLWNFWRWSQYPKLVKIDQNLKGRTNPWWILWPEPKSKENLYEIGFLFHSSVLHHFLKWWRKLLRILRWQVTIFFNKKWKRETWCQDNGKWLRICWYQLRWQVPPNELSTTNKLRLWHLPLVLFNTPAPFWT